jgi:type II secretory ATPase GspE/PulE/Tfp pilus assembly ATPase PilB-like protein
MARMSLSETSIPQDGHIKVKSSSKEIVCLVSTVPTGHGEHISIWIV